MVETELEKRKQQGSYKGGFRGQSHFFGYSVYFRYTVLGVARIDNINCYETEKYEEVLWSCFRIYLEV